MFSLLWSLRKSRRLRKISRGLAGKPDSGVSIMQSFAKGGFEAMRTILDEEDVQRRKLIDLVHKDPETSRVLAELNVSDKELDELYSSFIRQGAGVYRRGHWVAASSLVFGQTLEYAVKQKRKGDDHFKHACGRLIQYFNANETGPIQD